MPSTMTSLREEQIWDWLNEIPDPEVPVISVVELGVVRGVHISEEGVRIDITPTYSGCPAMRVMEQEIRRKLKENGIPHVVVRAVLAPPWTTDWMSESTREKLREYGIAPPERNATPPGGFDPECTRVACPFCGSENTRLQSPFGSTACKALYFCDGCRQPFEHFKCH